MTESYSGNLHICRRCGEGYNNPTPAETCCYERKIMPPSDTNKENINNFLQAMRHVMPPSTYTAGIEVSKLIDDVITIMDDSNAGVAQSAEQVPRKDEVVSSNLTSSSRLTEREMQLIREIVRLRVEIDDLEKLIESSTRAKNAAWAAANKATADYESASRAHNERIKHVESRRALYEADLEKAEAVLKRAIVEDLVVSGAPSPETEVKVEETTNSNDDHEELGRID